MQPTSQEPRFRLTIVPSTAAEAATTPRFRRAAASARAVAASVPASVSALATPAAAPWIERLARLGYVVKGVVYLLVAWLALAAGRGAGSLPSGTRDAFGLVVAEPFGRGLLLVIAVGLAGYALWRITAALGDAERKGDDARGLAVRGYYLASGLVHGALAWGAVRMVLGSGGGPRGDQTAGRTARLMAMPLGRWLVVLAGLAVLAAAAQQVRLAGGGYRKKVRTGGMTAAARRWLPRVAAAGLLARAVVFAIIGGFLVLAALHRDPHEARGLAGALRALESQPAGPWLLAIVALGLAAYGLFQLVEARYRPLGRAS